MQVATDITAPLVKQGDHYGVRTAAVGLLQPKLQLQGASSDEMTAISIISWLILTIPNVVIGISRSERRARKYRL